MHSTQYHLLLLRLVSALAVLLVLIPAGPAEADEEFNGIPFASNLRLIIRPTLLGLVPLEDPQGFGEALVRITTIDGSQVSLRYEIKEQVFADKTTGSQLEWWERPDPDVDLVHQTRIRRGEITANRHGASAEIINPMFWGDGSWETGTGLLWTSSAVIEDLREANSTTWFSFSWGDLPIEAVVVAEAIIRELTAEHAEDDERKLLLEGRANYPCFVNGVSGTVPALHVVDSWGVAEYWLLDDPANPLVLKMSFVPHRLDNPEADPLLALVNSGAGFAVTRIDY